MGVVNFVKIVLLKFGSSYAICFDIVKFYPQNKQPSQNSLLKNHVPGCDAKPNIANELFISIKICKLPVLKWGFTQS